ncbi:MAG: hypothetical protein ACQERV_09550, partial [Bacteroidota bacterium]
HLHFQVQQTPYVGSVTMKYPISHYILHSRDPFTLESYAYPELNDLVSNIERNELLHRAFHLIPGKRFHFRIEGHTDMVESAWEVNTDAYNNSFIRCHQTGSVAYFINDGNLIYFTHYSGDKRSLLYYFFLAAFQVQQGFYQDLTIRDRYPLNLIFRQPLLGLQDFVAPFWKFLRSSYECRYDWIDNEMSPSEIRIRSAARNYLSGRLLKEFDFSMMIEEKGIRSFVVDSGKLHLEATCTD